VGLGLGEIHNLSLWFLPFCRRANVGVVGGVQGRLIPYFEPAEDSRLERARRCVEGAINMAR
jgi:hypothetical protein